MEPMTLGSPGSSPAAVTPYLPSYLMGEQQSPAHPRTNTLSPNKQQCGGRQIGYGFGATTLGGIPSSPTEYNNSSILGRRLMYGSHPQLSSPHNTSAINNLPGTVLTSGTPNGANIIGGGPPTRGLFDTLQKDRTLMHTPQQSTVAGTLREISSPKSLFVGQNYFSNTANTSYNIPCHVLSPETTANTSFNANLNKSLMRSNYYQQQSTSNNCNDFWITVFGFPPSATPLILQHFGQCGTIVDKVSFNQNANWIHLRYSSRLECDKAITYNEKILADNIMIGVTHCKDKSILDKENQTTNMTETIKVRPLAQSAYKNAQRDISITEQPEMPQKTSGLMNKALDLFFGW